MMRQRRTRASASTGFGTIEVLVSVALYGIALVSLMGLLITSVTAGSIGDSSAVAVNLARQRLEALTALPPTSLIDEHGVTTTTQVPPGQGRPYTLAVTVEEQPAYVDVTVTVRWPVGARQYSRVLMTRVAR